MKPLRIPLDASPRSLTPDGDACKRRRALILDAGSADAYADLEQMT